ncbi:MAG: hypothetical protein A4E57_03163 [Syntrophorhabdaceae bacterium PtaU1.Bin034]|nr:MAG: hypothetical protein A4E57_03163 [Syntrophorhabdaceae bacterium PtaU1.Bin034]
MLFCSTLAALESTSSLVTPSAVTIALTLGFPSVRVPVLSKRTTSVRPASSRKAPPLTRIPALAARPMVATIAVGVARINAQGHPTISTAMARLSSPVAHQVRAALARIAGVNQRAYLSMILTASGLCASASTTSLTTLLRVVSSPTSVASTSMTPFWFNVPATRGSPIPFSTGIGSPVMADSSTAVIPFVTRPSTGMRSPGLTSMRSPTRTWSSGTTSAFPSTTIVAVSGAMSIRPWMAFRADSLVACSTSEPRTITKLTTAAAR